MGVAHFIFHGLFPDPVTSSADETSGSRILFDVEFEGELHSHLMADIKPVTEADGSCSYEVIYDLPFDCEDFPNAAVQYLQQVVGPQRLTISHSGPKGPIPGSNVYRVQWSADLDASRSLH